MFRDEAGAWKKKTTRLKDRTKAFTLAAEWERAGGMGRQRILTEAVSREIIGGILKRTTDEELRADTVREFCGRWLKGKELAKHEGTSIRYAGTVDKFLTFLAKKADSPLSAISPSDCERFNDHLIAKKLAPATRIVEIKTVRTMFNAALRQGIITTNPALAVQLPERFKQVVRMQFTPAQVQILLDAAKDPEWRTVALLAYYGGLRLSDAVSLDWECVKFSEGKLVLDVKKTGQEITLPMHPTLEAHLQTLAGDKGGPVCPGLASVPVGGRSGLSKQFLAIMRTAGISNESQDCRGQRHLSRLSFHSLRVSFNSELHNRSVSQETRKKLTGHKSDSVNDRYTRTEMSTLRKAVDKLPRLKT